MTAVSRRGALAKLWASTLVYAAFAILYKVILKTAGRTVQSGWQFERREYVFMYIHYMGVYGTFALIHNKAIVKSNRVLD